MRHVIAYNKLFLYKCGVLVSENMRLIRKEVSSCEIAFGQSVEVASICWGIEEFK